MTIEWKEYENGKSDKNFFSNLLLWRWNDCIVKGDQILLPFKTTKERERERKHDDGTNETRCVHLVDSLSLYLDVLTLFEAHSKTTSMYFFCLVCSSDADSAAVRITFDLTLFCDVVSCSCWCKGLSVYLSKGIKMGWSFYPKTGWNPNGLLSGSYWSIPSEFILLS